MAEFSRPMSGHLVYFFFQAEDGIRDYKVTGVQTCALPIWHRTTPSRSTMAETPLPPSAVRLSRDCVRISTSRDRGLAGRGIGLDTAPWLSKIGRASCRERV